MYWYISYAKYILQNWIIFSHVRLRVHENFLHVTIVHFVYFCNIKLQDSVCSIHIHVKTFSMFELLRRETI